MLQNSRRGTEMSRKNRTPAIAYLRTSSAANVGADRDSDKRQRKAIEAFAKRAGFDIAAEFYDQAVSGADPIQDRPGFSALLDQIEVDGVRTVIVEDASRFARELMVQVLGILMLCKREVKVLTASGDDLTESDDPSRKMMRQIAGAFAEYEKARLVAKLRGARERRREAVGKCEGRRTLRELHPDAVRMAKRLRRTNPQTGKRRSFATIAAELSKAGYFNSACYRGTSASRPFSPATIRAMVEGPAPNSAS
jgi:DNA invertase Pin-like site-specific DNA recombinase